MRRSTQNKSYHIACRMDKHGVLPSVSDQAAVEKLAPGPKSPVNNGQEAAHTRPLPNNGPQIMLPKPKTPKKMESGIILHCHIFSFYKI